LLVGEVAQSSLTNKRTIIVNNRLERTMLLYLKLFRSNGLRSLVKSCLLLVFMQCVINIGLSVGVDLLLEEGVESVKKWFGPMVSKQNTSENCADKDFRMLPVLQYQNGKPTLQNKDSPRKRMPSPQIKSRRIRWASVTVTLTENKTQRMISIV